MRTVCVIIPTKDRPAFLSRSLKSACLACREHDEIIVVDDHSSTQLALSEDAVSDPRVKVVTLPIGVSGVSAARNAGIAACSKDIVSFLDDDDEMLPHYVEYIANVASAQADYGFSSYMHCRNVCGGPDINTMSRVRFSEGLITPHALFRKLSFGLGMGFWIHKKFAARVAPLDVSISMNEDTEYACQLLSANARGWYSEKPGVTVHDHSSLNTGQLANLTHRVDPAERARCMRVLCERFPRWISHLGRSYIRHCIKAGLTKEARVLIKSQATLVKRADLMAYYWMKKTIYALAKFRSPKT